MMLDDGVHGLMKGSPTQCQAWSPKNTFTVRIVSWFSCGYLFRETSQSAEIWGGEDGVGREASLLSDDSP